MPDMQECWHPVHPCPHCPQSPDSPSYHDNQLDTLAISETPSCKTNTGLPFKPIPFSFCTRPILQLLNQFRNPARNVRNADRLNGLSI